MINALTVDLEDWYQGLTSTGKRIEAWNNFEDRIAHNSQILLELFDHAKVQGTFFVLGHLANTHPNLIRNIVDCRHEIALHSHSHKHLASLTPEEFQQDTQKGRKAVEKASSMKVLGYRAPMFSLTRSTAWALDILREMGFRYDSSIFPVINPWYGFPSAPRYPYHPFGDDFMEFPLSTARIMGFNIPIAGGFYLRLLPLQFIIKSIKKINKQGQPAILYIHPWDLDPFQPLQNPTLRERFTHYYNLLTTKSKIQILLKEFRFAPINTML